MQPALDQEARGELIDVTPECFEDIQIRSGMLTRLAEELIAHIRPAEMTQ